mgnify:FL=1
MFELLEPFLMFFFFFLLPVFGVCSIPALLMGGIMLNMAEKNKSDKN